MFYRLENKRSKMIEIPNISLFLLSIKVSGKVFYSEVFEIYFAFFKASFTEALKML